MNNKSAHQWSVNEQECTTTKNWQTTRVCNKKALMKTQQKKHKKLIRTKTQENYLKKKNCLITFQNI